MEPMQAIKDMSEVLVIQPNHSIKDEALPNVGQESFPDKLDMAPFVHEQLDGMPLVYNLKSIVRSLPGHYTAYLRDGHRWWCTNDDHVEEVFPPQVEPLKAFLIFYVREETGTSEPPISLVRFSFVLLILSIIYAVLSSSCVGH